jgi:hypothetical protein
VPGRRNYARERAHHDRIAPARQQAFHDLLVAQLPDRDHALIGWRAILDYFSTTLQVTRRNGGVLTHRIVLRWVATQGCPLLRGNRHPRYAQPPLTTTFALTAWLLSRRHLGEHLGLGPSVAIPQPLPEEGRRAA